jgi:hypothetical protein
MFGQFEESQNGTIPRVSFNQLMNEFAFYYLGVGVIVLISAFIQVKLQAHYIKQF